MTQLTIMPNNRTQSHSDWIPEALASNHVAKTLLLQFWCRGTVRYQVVRPTHRRCPRVAFPPDLSP